jgi:hypothetical protein
MTTSKPPVIVTAKRPKPRRPEPKPEAQPLRIVVARKPTWRPLRRKPDPETDQA